MGCISRTATYCLLGLNTVLLISGIGILTAGVLMKYDKAVISDEVLPLLRKIELSAFSLGDLISGLAITCLAVGTVLIVIVGLGILGVCCQSRCLLILYALVVALAMLAEIVAVGMWFFLREQLTDWLKAQFKTILNDYDGKESSELTVAWDTFFIVINCCGVNRISKYNDFTSSIWWSSRGSQEIPPSCCVGATSSNLAAYVNTNCTISPTPSNSHIDIGCYEQIHSTLETYSATFVAVSIVIATTEFVASLFAYLLYKEIKMADG
ncbi:hypothetical protein ScPMuIL_002679 [Solemya velum]